MRTEIDDHVALLYHHSEIVSLINLTHYSQRGITAGASDKSLPHASLCSRNDDPGHVWSAIETRAISRIMFHVSRFISKSRSPSSSHAASRDFSRSWEPAAIDIPLGFGPSSPRLPSLAPGWFR